MMSTIVLEHVEAYNKLIIDDHIVLERCRGV